MLFFFSFGVKSKNMRKLAIGLILSIASSAYSQLHPSKSVSMNLNFDAGIHLALYKPEFNGVSFGTDSSAAGTTLVRLNPQFHILNWLSAGIDFRWGGYIEDPDNAEAAGNKIRTTSLFVRLIPVNKDKFAWYIGAGLGMNALHIRRRFGIIPTLHEYRFSGGGSFIDTGINFMATKNLGFNFNLGYMGSNMKLRNYIINGSDQNISNWNNYMNTKGVTIGLGLTFAFMNG
jgi:hypothetical protein